MGAPGKRTSAQTRHLLTTRSARVARARRAAASTTCCTLRRQLAQVNASFRDRDAAARGATAQAAAAAAEARAAAVRAAEMEARAQRGEALVQRLEDRRWVRVHVPCMCHSTCMVPWVEVEARAGGALLFVCLHVFT